MNRARSPHPHPSHLGRGPGKRLDSKGFWANLSLMKPMCIPSREAAPAVARLGLTLAACAVLLAPVPVTAANLLVNPGFEQNSGHVLPVAWTRYAPPTAQPFGNYWIEDAVPPRSGALYWKQWGAVYDAAVSNVAGLYQDFGSAPGSIYEAGGWFYTKSNDVLGPNCRTWIEVAFLGAGGQLLALYKSDDFTAEAGMGEWLWYPVDKVCDVSTPVPSGDPYYTTYAVTGTVSQAIAPIGTQTVRYRYAYLQAGKEGGAAFLDDALLDQVSGPLPPVIENLMPLNMIFADPKEGLTFRARSPSGFAINASGIQVVVNGADVSGALSVTGPAANREVAYYGLESNRVYTASIAVTDAVGFTATTTTAFETAWAGLPPVIYLWEAEDYDFDQGQYVNDPVLCTVSGNPQCYFGKTGVEGVDYHSVVANTSHAYRPDDPLAIGIAGDALRKPLVVAGRQDYRIDPFIGGEWLQYTRDWPQGAYWVSARLATGEGLSGSLTLSRVEPDTSMTDLGTFTIDSGKGWTAYENVLLRDADGNVANVMLDGKATLRVTSGGNLLPNFFMLSAAQLDLPVLSNLYPTGKHPFEPTNQLRFTLTTVGATFPEGGVTLELNGVDVSTRLLGSGSDSNRTYVCPLAPNGIYTAVIAATNSLGNGIAQTVRFDTFSEQNLMIEAEEFDYDGGQYIADWYPGAYSFLGAMVGIDYSHAPFENEQFPYRFEGIPQEIARDHLRQVFIEWGGTDYHLAWFGAGDWANYTRSFAPNDYLFYARSGGFGPFTMALDQVVSGAGTVSQVTRRLGLWSGAGQDNQTHEWIPLTDAGLGSPVVVRLAGSTTLRISTDTGNCHPSYIMGVAASPIPLSAVRSGANVVVSFPTQAGWLYRVFSCDRLSVGHWTLLTTVVGDGGTGTCVDAAIGTRFYRVVAP